MQPLLYYSNQEVTILLKIISSYIPHKVTKLRLHKVLPGEPINVAQLIKKKTVIL